MLAIALAVLPLQGVAATLAVLVCHGDAQAHASHDAGGGEHHHHHDGTPDEGGTGGGQPLNHLCCNVTVSAPPVTIFSASAAEFPVRTPFSNRLHARFFPEQPQRPPLA